MDDHVLQEPPAYEPDPSLTIVQLTTTYEAFGLIVDFLSRIKPFSEFEISNLCGVIRNQLKDSHHLVAMAGKEIVGYAGWLRTPTAEAEAWTEGRAILRPSYGPTADAAVLTVFAVTDTAAIPRLIRGARELNKGTRVFFKREFTASSPTPRKAVVLNFSQD